MSKKVLFIVGSLRKGGFNKTVADYAASVLENAGAEVEFLDYANIPYMNQDIEFPAPAEVAAVREKVITADGLWYVTPEYNGSVPGVLKNLFDWLSRPLDPSKMAEPRILANKPVTISGAGGATATLNSRTHLAEISRNLVGGGSAVIGGHGVGIQIPGEAWGSGVLTLSDEQKHELNRQAEEFLASL